MNLQKVVSFCARECELQMSGERSVGWMFDAWWYAWEMGDFGPRLPVVDDVLTLGRLTEPKKNGRGFRTCWVQVGVSTIDWQHIPTQMVNLMEAADSLTPEEFFLEYEKIHPFVDGNGRTGQILYNWLNGSLHDPVFAPNFFNDSRRNADVRKPT